MYVDITKNTLRNFFVLVAGPPKPYVSIYFFESTFYTFYDYKMRDDINVQIYSVKHKKVNVIIKSKRREYSVKS